MQHITRWPGLLCLNLLKAVQTVHFSWFEQFMLGLGGMFLLIIAINGIHPVNVEKLLYSTAYI